MEDAAAADRAEIDAINAVLKDQNAKSQSAEDAFDAAIRGNPGLMKLAHALLAGADIAAPLLAGAFGGPGAMVIAGAALKAAHAAENAAGGG